MVGTNGLGSLLVSMLLTVGCVSKNCEHERLTLPESKVDVREFSSEDKYHSIDLTKLSAPELWAFENYHTRFSDLEKVEFFEGVDGNFVNRDKPTMRDLVYAYRAKVSSKP